MFIDVSVHNLPTMTHWFIRDNRIKLSPPRRDFASPEGPGV